MDQRIRDRYSDQILQQALEAYQVQTEEAQELDSFESYIYQIQRKGGEGILRITHSMRRTPDLIRGELDWIQRLHQGGAGVSLPLRSHENRLVEVFPDGAGGIFIAAAFEKAPGEPHRGQEWPGSLLGEYGRQIGRMHYLATTYQPADLDWKRPDWDDPIHLDAVAFIPEKEIRDRYWEATARIQALPRDGGAFGLIHRDPHRGNFFVDQSGGITFFDFDDSSYSWFVEDIALILFYAVMGQEDPEEFIHRFLDGFLPGYFSAYPLEDKWFREIPAFMKLRELDLYAVIHRSFDVENLTDPWCQWYLEGRKERLVQGLPYLEFDFSSLKVQDYR